MHQQQMHQQQSVKHAFSKFPPATPESQCEPLPYLALGVVEVGGHSDDSVLHSLSKEGLSGLL